MLQTIAQISNRRPDPATPSPWQHFTAMPHHAMFTVGTLQAVLAILWWVTDLAGRYGQWFTPMTWSVPPAWAHFFLLIFGLFPPYMFGFLMTTYPRWMSGMPVARHHYLLSAGLLGVGILFTYGGLVLGRGLLLTALLIYITGWAVALYALLRVYATAQRPDVLHARITSGVMAIGLLLLAIYWIGILREEYGWISLAREGGIWWFLFPVFFAVSHRLIPFFSQSAIPDYVVFRPDWTLWAMTIGALVHGALAWTGFPAWLWLVDLPMAAVALWMSWRWAIRRTFHIRILAMLHVAFVWAGIALLVIGLQSLGQYLGFGFLSGRSALHALLIGYFTSMLIAMSTRVTLGHSGQPLVADRQAWGLFIAIQIAAAIRLLAETPLNLGHPFAWLLSSTLIWIAAFLLWSYKFMPLYWRTHAR